MNNKVNSANLKVVFRQECLRQNQIKHDKERLLWGILLQNLNAKISFDNVYCLCISAYFSLSLRELPWAVAQLTLP